MHYDKEHVLSTVGEDADLLRQVLRLTRDELLDSEQDLDLAFKEQDLSHLVAVGHKLYGISITSGLKQLAFLANELAQIGEFEVDKVEGMINKIRKEIKTCLELIS